MPRIRTIKPEFWTDSAIVQLSPLARLLFIGSWNFCDDYGCLSPDPVELKLRVLPMEQVDAHELAAELFAGGLLELMENPQGETFWHIRNFERHQKVDKRSKPTYGDPQFWSRPSPPNPAESRRGLPEVTPRKEGKEGRKEVSTPREDSAEDRGPGLARLLWKGAEG